MEKFVFKNSGGRQRNEVVFPGKVFDLENKDYVFRLIPKVPFWRFGIRLSRTENVEFFEESRHGHGRKDLIDITVAIGKLIDEQKKLWGEPNKIQLAQYNMEWNDHIIDEKDSYIQLSEVTFKINYDKETNLLMIGYGFGEVYFFEIKFTLINYKSFQLFAWSDWIDFEIECLIEDTKLDSALKRRIFFLGNNYVGKTKIMDKIFDRTFISSDRKFGGIEISEWEFETSPGTKTVIDIWDFGSKEIASSLFRVFLTDDNVYIVVIDVSRENVKSSLEYWLMQIKMYANGASTFIVFNKGELNSYNFNRNELLEKFPFVINIILVSLLTEEGINVLRKAIQTLLIRLSFVSEKISPTWKKILTELRKKQADYIDWNEFSTICQMSGIEEDNVVVLAKSLPNSGNFYFHSTKFVSLQLIVLNIEWLLNGLSLILAKSSNNSPHGFLQTDSLNLSVQMYPEKTHEVFLDIMTKFDLCIPLNSTKSIYIIPTLLKEGAPLFANTFKVSDCLNYYYVYKLLPNTLFFKFVTEVNSLIYKSYLWKNGVVLYDRLNHALVTVNLKEQRIELNIKGPVEGRKTFLDAIKQEFDKTHKQFDNLNIEERIPVPQNPEASILHNDLLVMMGNGIKFLPVVIGKTTVNINIKNLVNGIIEPEIKLNPINILVLYSVKDEDWKKKLFSKLYALQRKEKIELLGDHELVSSDTKSFTLINKIRDADIIIVLISVDLLTSGLHCKEYLKLSFDLHQTGKLKLIPILVKETAWSESPIGQLKALPSNGESLSSPDFNDSDWASIVSEFQKIVLDIRKKPKIVDNLFISKIRLINIRCFQEIEIKLYDDQSKLGMFSLILGENGIGKTTILRAIVIGSAGESEAAGLVSQTSGEILRTGEKQGEITIEYLSTGNYRVYSVITKLNRLDNGQISITKQFPDDFPGKRLFICGYGAGRSGFGTENVGMYSISNATPTLFNYNSRLQNPELSLRRIESKGISIEAITQKVDKLLMLDSGSTVVDSFGVRIQGPWGKFMPIGSLGDGYIATIGWILDLLGWSLLFNENMLRDNICGIVIIDELEQHLHPRWQRIIIKTLKDHFPKIQFIISTHTPLLASGVADFEDGYIFSLEWEANGKVSLREVSNSLIEGKNINNVLSEAFGMSTTLSLKSMFNLERFAELSSRKDLNETEKTELDILIKEMNIDSGPIIDDDLKRKIAKNI